MTDIHPLPNEPIGVFPKVADPLGQARGNSAFAAPRTAPRLIVISNRVVIPGAAPQQAAGGLAVAVKAAMKQRVGMWFGWSGVVSDAPDTVPRTVEQKKIVYKVIDLTREDFQEYYNGFANRALWPLFHYRVDLAEYTHTDLGGYTRVNKIFADTISKIINDNDIIWVHDYHLMPLAKELRCRGHENPIGFFLHIPCPPPDILFTLPRHEESLGTLTYYDLVGFQTENDRDNFGRYFASQGGRLSRDRCTFTIDGRFVRVEAFPVSIETSVFARLARTAGKSVFAREMLDSLAGQHLLLGVDRLDYSKGLTHRIDGFDRFLTAFPEWCKRVTFLQISPTSRSDIQEYAALAREVSELVGRVNGRHGEAAWTPIRYVNRSYSRAALAGLYRSAKVALVTPMRDGMNLVAKEFVAAQDPDNPGVLILSRFAGAAAELEGALIINPHEAEAFPRVIRRALDMPRDERQARHNQMFKRIQVDDVDGWASRYLEALAGTQRRNRFDGRRALSSIGP